jgi:hypothetical protein
MQSSLRTGSQGELCSRTLLETGLRLHVFRIAFRNEKHLSVPFRKAIFMQRNYCNGAIYLTWEPAVYYGLPSNTDTSLIRTPFFYEHISNTDTSLLRTSLNTVII